MAGFDDRKQAVLEGLASEIKDKSRAGGVDAPIASLIDRINRHPQYFTTSSCSGRISIFSESAPDDNGGAPTVGKKTKKKKGGDWVYVSHETAVESEVLESVKEYCVTMEKGLHSNSRNVTAWKTDIGKAKEFECKTSVLQSIILWQVGKIFRNFTEERVLESVKKYCLSMEDGLLVFRFEPFILALECRTPATAQLLVACAVSAGFRESGITGMGKRNIVGVRCSIRLEVPIVQAGHTLVSDDYLRFLTTLSNKKMELNRQRTDSFLVKFIDQVENQNGQRLPELERSLSIEEYVPSEFLPIIGLNGLTSANGARDFHDQTEKKFSIDKESKMKISALKGRQLKLLARLKILEDGRLLTTGAISDGQTLRSQGDSVFRSKITSPETEPSSSPSNGGGKSDGCSLSAAHLEVRGEPIERLRCWSHSVVQSTEVNGQHSLLLYGGFGGPGRHARLGNSLVLDCLRGDMKCLETSYAPPPRMSHIAVVIGQRMVVVGGRYDPSTCLGDVCVLDLMENSWHFPKITGDYFLPRHRHAAARVGNNIYVFGGMNQNTVLSDFYVLNSSSWEWKCINSGGDMPPARYSHTLAAVGQKLYLFGGRDARRAYGDLHVFCLQTNTWTLQKGLGELGTPRFSHSMTAVGKWLLVLGGCPITHHGTDLVILDVEKMVCRRIPLMQAPLDVLLVRHTATLLGTKLVVVGGGAACFAFGAKFNVPFSVDLEPFLGKHSCETGVGTNRDSFGKDECSDGCEKRTWVLRLDRKTAKIGKDSLKQLGWLDQKRRPKVLDERMQVAFPITEEAALYLKDAGSYDRIPSVMSRGLNQEFSQELISKLVATKGEVVQMQLAYDAHRPISPSVTLEADVSKLLQEVGLPQALLEDLPKRWERLEDMAILPAGSLASSSWSSIGPALWPVIASALGSRRIARQAPVAATKTRDSKLELLFGENGWVEHRENGLLYCFDATKCMFSSGNVSEKLRMASMKCSGEIIVDLFAGIGYYVLPFLVKGGAKLVYACEWNPNAIGALRHNLLVNGVENRCVVLEGDNRLTSPKGVADRVCLGLLPSSEGSWGVAIGALRPEGGMLHVHENVKDTNEAQWLVYLVSALSKLSVGLDRHWEVKVVHLERVKWYAPHIRHVVADVQCSLQ